MSMPGGPDWTGTVRASVEQSSSISVGIDSSSAGTTGSARSRSNHARRASRSRAPLGDPRHDVRAAATVVVGKRRTMQLSGEYTWSVPDSRDPAARPSRGQPVALAQVHSTTSEPKARIDWRFAEHLFPFERWKLRATVAVAGVPSGSGPVRDCPLSPRPSRKGGLATMCPSRDPGLPPSGHAVARPTSREGRFLPSDPGEAAL